MTPEFDGDALIAKLETARRRHLLSLTLAGRDADALMSELAFYRALAEEQQAMLEAAARRVMTEDAISTQALGVLEHLRGDVDRARKVSVGAKKGHEIVYGTDREKEVERQEALAACRKAIASHPEAGIGEIRRLAALACQVSEKTIERRVKNLRELMNSPPVQSSLRKEKPSSG